VAVAGRTAVDGLSVATGSYRNGVLLAPVLADAVVRGLELSGPDASGRLSPAHPGRMSSRRSAADAFKSGLADLALLLEDGGASWWRDRLEAILGALAALGSSGEQAEALRQHVNVLMQRYPRPEMVPEVLVELLQELDEVGQPRRTRSKDPSVREPPGA